MDDNDMRFAHCDGHTDVCYDDSGKYIVTCGTDGDVRIWNGFEDEDFQSHHMGSTVTSVALKSNILYLATDNFAVSAYSFPEAEFEQIIAQFNTEVYHIVCSKDGKSVACGGGDFVIKMYDTSTKSLIAFNGHTGPVLSIVFDPKGEFLASSACDGTVRIWNLCTQECIKTLNLFKKSNDFSTSSTLCRLDWSPDGQYLAIPLETKVCFYKRNNWQLQNSLFDDQVTKTFSIVTFSPFGKYIAAATINGQMLVWDVELDKCVSRKFHEKEIAVSGLKWNPSGSELAFCDIEGQLGLYSCPFQKDNQKNDLIQEEAVEKDDMSIDNMDIFDNEEDEENAFDIGAIKASLEPVIFGNKEEDAESVKQDPEPKVQIIQAPKAPVQTSFQPSSTPVNLERRFMVWNNVGIVRSYNTEEENSIDVEFHDANVYHPLHMNNSTRNHTLAALSTEALLLASPKQDDGATSQLECLHFGTWDANKEWIVEMPEDEEIETIALGDGFAVCVTDKKYVRLYTVSGVQCEVFVLPGPVVSCTAKDNQVLIVYHKGLGVEDNQCLNLMIVKVKLGGHCTTREYFLPLSSQAFLSWLGFTDEGKPCIGDTSGVISLLSVSCGTKWVPIANTNSNSKGKSDTYWIIGVSEIKQEIRCILCKAARYPALLPRPTTSVLPFSLPFLDMGSGKGKLEEENGRFSLAHHTLELLLKDGYEVDLELKSVEKKWMDVLLKMFALATRSDREFRALNIAELMPNPMVVQGAIKYATEMHRMALAERLGEVMNKKLSKDTDEDEDDFDIAAYEESESLISKKVSTPSLNLHKEDNLLKPTPLSRIRNSINKGLENSDENVDTGSSLTSTPSNSRSLFSKASPINNPFKASSKGQASKDDINNISGIDDLLNNSMKNVTSRNSASSDSTEKAKKSRFQLKKNSSPKTSDNSSEKVKSGFNLYLEENRGTIQATASPDATDKEIVQMAVKLYKELPKSEKQKYMKNNDTKILKENQTLTATNAAESFNEDESSLKENCTEDQDGSLNGQAGKRKEDHEDITPKPKKLKLNQDKLSDKTVRKLTQFAFTKTPK